MKLHRAKLQHSFFETFKHCGDLHLSQVSPSGLQQPVLVSANRQLANELGLDPDSLDSEEFLQLMAGHIAGEHFGKVVPDDHQVLCFALGPYGSHTIHSGTQGVISYESTRV